MTKHYRKNITPGRAPTEEELDKYLGRIGGLGQIDHCEFSGVGHISILVAGIAFALVAIGAGVLLLL